MEHIQTALLLCCLTDLYQILQNLHDVLLADEDQQEFRRAVREILAELRAQQREQQVEQKTIPLPVASLSRAEGLLEENQNEQARTILQSLIALYHGDSNFAHVVKKAKELLNEIPTTPAESTTP